MSLIGYGRGVQAQGVIHKMAESWENKIQDRDELVATDTVKPNSVRSNGQYTLLNNQSGTLTEDKVTF